MQLPGSGYRRLSSCRCRKYPKAAFRKGPHEGKRPQASEKLSPASNLMHELGSKFFSPVESYDDSSSGHSLTAAL